jgi:Zn-dependent M28 family amino/carboxypeptidase
MRRLMTILLLASMLVVSFPSSFAQRNADKAKKAAASVTTQRGTDTITASQMHDYLTFIASDEMEGRDTPSRGLDTTAKFIATNLGRWGFKPAGDNGTFFQTIELRRDRADGGQTMVEFFGRTLNSGVEYIPLAGSGVVNAPMVFAGNGWFVKSKNVDAYKDIDPTGKIAIIYGSPSSLPRGLARGDLTGKANEDYINPSEYARRKGVVGLVYVPDIQFLTSWERTRRFIMDRGSIGVAKFQPQSANPLPSIVVSPEIASGILVGEKANANQLYNGYYGTGLPASFALNPEKKLSLNLANRSEIIPTQNVVAVWEGSDPVLKNEYVAIGAHYDHVGICAPNATDQICNGADDDGSGTTGMLALAEALSKAPTRPKRSVLFVWHCGEEKGLWGSRYFTEYPTVPLNQIVTQLNMDMIGRSKKEGDTNARNKELTGPNDIYVIGSTMMSSELAEILETVNKSYLNLGFDKKYDDPADPNRFFYRSDHYNYAKKGIPIIFFFDGEHEDYHRPGDSPDKIDYQKMEKVARTVYMMMWEVATRPTRPKVDKPLPAQLSTN